jgi:hypothetical protein
MSSLEAVSQNSSPASRALTLELNQFERCAACYYHGVFSKDNLQHSCALINNSNESIPHPSPEFGPMADHAFDVPPPLGGLHLFVPSPYNGITRTFEPLGFPHLSSIVPSDILDPNHDISFRIDPPDHSSDHPTNPNSVGSHCTNLSQKPSKFSVDSEEYAVTGSPAAVLPRSLTQTSRSPSYASKFKWDLFEQLFRVMRNILHRAQHIVGVRS